MKLINYPKVTQKPFENHPKFILIIFLRAWGGGSGKWEALLIINFWWNGPGGKWEGGSSNYFFFFESCRVGSGKGEVLIIISSANVGGGRGSF